MEIGALNELLATLQPAAPAPAPAVDPAVAAAAPAPASEPAPAAAPIQAPQVPVQAVPLVPQAPISAPEPVIPEPTVPALHPMAQRISEMLASGESPEAVRRFVEVQTIDTTRLSDMDAVRFNFQNKYPFLAPAEVDAKIIQEIGIDPTGVDAPDAGQSAALKIAANQARTEINSQKVNASAPAVTAPVSQVPATQTTPVVNANPAVEQGWMKVLEAATPTFANLPIKAEVPEIGAYAHDFQFSPEAVAFARAEVQKLAVQNNMPFDQASLGRLQGIAQKLMIAHDFQSIVASVAKDAYESGRTSVAARVAGSPTVAAPITAPVAGSAAPKPVRLPLVG